MPEPVTISIPETHDRAELPGLLRVIASQIEDDYREGYHPRWIVTPVEPQPECRWGQDNGYVDCGGPSETVQGVRLCDAHADAVESTGFPEWARGLWAPNTDNPTT